MSIPVFDMLEGNPEALATRERYREIVKALGESQGSFVARYEIRLLGNGTCTLIATSSRGAECDADLCNMAVAMISALTDVRAGPPTVPTEPSGTGEGGDT